MMAENILKRRVEKEKEEHEQYVQVPLEIVQEIMEKNGTQGKFNVQKIPYFKDDRKVTKPTYLAKPEPVPKPQAVQPVSKNSKYEEKTDLKAETKKQQYQQKTELKTEGTKIIFEQKKVLYEEKFEAKQAGENKKQKYSAKPNDYDSRSYRVELILPKKSQQQRNLLYIENDFVESYVKTAKRLLNDYAFIVLKAFGNNVGRAVHVSQSLASEYSGLKRVNNVAEQILEEHHYPIGDHGKQFYTKVARASIEIKMSLNNFELDSSSVGFQDCRQPEKRSSVIQRKERVKEEGKEQIEEVIKKDRRGYQQNTSSQPREYGKNRKVYRERDPESDRRQPVQPEKRSHRPKDTDRREDKKYNRYQERPANKPSQPEDERDYR